VSHPEDLLADYVDGTLDERERAAVDAHLLGCARCAAEVRQADAARAVLAELENVPVPFGVTGPVLAEAGRRFERRPGVVWGRFQWAAGLAAAAALVVVVALNVGGDDAQNAAADATVQAGLYRGKRRVLRQRSTVKAYRSRIVRFRTRFRRGRYTFRVTLRAAMNPSRSKSFSAPLRITK
jgi:anti-sigma factor RsiW